MRRATRLLGTTGLVLATALLGAACAPQATGSTSASSTTTSSTTSATTATSTPARPARDACTGVSNCRIVTSRDVDGDGAADQVGWRQVSQRSVQVRVMTASGHLLTSKVDVSMWWGGGAWGGTARVDAVPGAELLVGSMQGAHTPMYTMLTYRAGKLVVEKSPSSLGPLWLVDAADGDYIGWWRHTLRDGSVAMTQKVAARVGAGHRFRGHDTTYVWTKSHWSRTSSTAVSYPSGKAASVIAGFHVGGLAKFPGLR